MTSSWTLEETLDRIRPVDQKAAARARSRQAMLTKPPGALGVLEDISVRVASMLRDERPMIRNKAVVVAAADHGVVAQGVTDYPPEVTAQMVGNFLAGGAAISVMAELLNVKQLVVDAGIAADPLPSHPRLHSLRLARRTGDISLGPAMSRRQAIQSLEAGIALAVRVAGDEDANLIAVGDMGIGNTTVTSAVVAAITRRPPQETTGAGTGRTRSQLDHKVVVVRRALEINSPASDDPLDVLAKVGGFEIGVLAGVLLGGAAMGCVMVLDGFISGASALIATGLCPTATEYMIASHRSAEAGHQVVLSHLRLQPLLDLGMRLGEGTGAVLAMPIIEAAAACLADMATFDQAGVSKARVSKAGVSKAE